VEGRDMANVFPGIGDKVQIIPADLPTLPADADIPDVDVVLHCAADRNFWDGYFAVKPVNVDTAKALARLCLHTGATLHVLSSGAIAAYEGENTSSGNLPRPTPDDGYLSSKWVAERYLARVARETGLPLTAHRPTRVSDAEALRVEQMAKTEIDMANIMLSLSEKLNVRPDFTNLGGIIDLTPLVDAVEAVAQAVTTNSQTSSGGINIVNHAGTARMRTNALAAHAEELFGRPENSAVMGLPCVSALHWVGLAKRAGLFEWFFTAQDLVVEDGEGNKIASRR